MITVVMSVALVPLLTADHGTGGQAAASSRRHTPSARVKPTRAR